MKRGKIKEGGRKKNKRVRGNQSCTRKSSKEGGKKPQTVFYVRHVQQSRM